jgi:hypothetical protein
VCRCKTLALLVEAHNGARLLSPPLLKGVDIFGRQLSGALGLIPLRVYLEAQMAETGKGLGP